MTRRAVDDELLARRVIRRLKRLGVREVAVEQRARKVVARGAVADGRVTHPIQSGQTSSPLEALEALAEEARDRLAAGRSKPKRAQAARLARSDVIPPRRRPDPVDVEPAPEPVPSPADDRPTPADPPAHGRDKPRGGR